MLVLDAGAAILGQWVSVMSDGRVMVEAMNAMGYDAMAVGALDALKGLDVLQERASEAEFPFLSANLIGAEDESLLFEPYTIIQRDDRRFGIIGLTDSDILAYPGVGEKVQVLDPIEITRSWVDALRPQVDVLIVLSHLGLEYDQLLADSVDGIDIIVGGYSRRVMQEPVERSGTLIVQQGYRGEWLGRLETHYDQDGTILEATEEMIVLDDQYPDDPEVAAIVERYRTLYPTPTLPPTPEPEATPSS